MSRPTQRRFTLAELAEAVGCEVVGEATTPIVAVCNIEDAIPGSLVRAETRRHVAAAVASAAAALLVGPEVTAAEKPLLRVANPRLAFARLLARFAPEERPAPGIDPTASVASDAEVGEGCAILAYAVIGAGARLGRNVVVHPHCVVGEGAVIGDDTILFPHVVIYPRVRLGARVRVHAGVVLGADGFGYVWHNGHRKIPQIGGVEIGDEVEIGANSCIDGGTTGPTRIGSGTKIDNLVQIGHNVTVGEHGMLVAHVGIGGSTRLGRGVVIGGASAIRDHVTIGDGAQIAGASAVWDDIAAGAAVSGNPARPHRHHMRGLVVAERLPELLQTVRRLERRLAALEERLARNEPS